MDTIHKTLLLGSKVKKFAQDGWENLITGVGQAGKDKRTGNQISRRKTFQREVEILHDSDDIAKLAVNEVPDRGTTKWIYHKVGKEDGGIEKANELIKEEKRLKVKQKFKQAWAWARLYGGAGIYVSIDDGLDPSEPVNLERIVKINSLTVLHRYELQRGSLNANIDDPNFGLPETFNITGRTDTSVPKIHHSRIIRFDGSPLSEQEFKNNDYWHDSVLNILMDIIRDYNGAYAGISSAMQDFDVSILKIKDLAEIISADEDDLLLGRVKLMNLVKSVMGSIMIDAEDEDYQNVSRQFANVDKILEKMDQRLVMAMRMPHTVVLGNGSAGTLGASGESEGNNMNALVSAQQDEVLEDNIDRMNELTQSQKQGPTSGNILESHSWGFNPLSEPSEKDVSETRLNVAKGDEIYLKYGAVSSDEVAESRFGGDEYSPETAIDLDSRKEQKETDIINPEQTKKIMDGVE